MMLGLSSLFLRERPSITVWVTSALAYCALFLFTGAPSRVSLSSLFFAFGMAATLSVYVVMTRSLRSESTRANLFYTAFGVALCLLPFIPGLWITPTLGDFLTMAAIGVVGFVALWALDRSTAVAPASVSAPFFFVQLPTSMFLGRLLGYAQFGVKGLMATVILALCGLYLWTREDGAAVPARVA
jgi:drug/metabolite transporter (DMT)-like permease